jgi:beta-phosphoglucomutase
VGFLRMGISVEKALSLLFLNENNDVIKACIFDLDGVIVDTAHYHFLAWKRLANELNIDLTLEDNEKLKGVSRMHSLQIILDLGGVKMPIDEQERLADKKNAWFVEYLAGMKADEIFKGVKPLLNELRLQGLKIGLASSSKNAPTVLRLLNIEDLFDVVVDGTMITHSKPHPEIFLLAASRLGLAPSECLVFEDAEAGVESAIAAGMKCIGVGSPQQLAKADVVIAATGDFDVSSLPELAVA